MLLNLDPGVTRKRAVLKQLPATPHTGWKAPSFFPDVRDAALISIDTETKELDFGHGPGWARNAGHIVGVSLAALSKSGDVWRGYFPLRHEVETHDNMDAAQVLRWFKDMVETPVPKTGANLIYDVGWLGEEGIEVQGPLYDTQFAEALLDESGPTALDFLANKYLGVGKTSSFLYDWCARAYGGKAGGKQRANIYRTPPSLVGFYGEADAELPLRILPIQWGALALQELIPLYEMECRLIRVLIKMRRRGIEIDLPYAEKLYGELRLDIGRLQAEFDERYGLKTNLASGEEIEHVFKRIGLHYPRTAPSASYPNGQPSFTKDWLHNLDHPIGQEINRIRELEKLRGTFVKSYLLEKNVNGKIHCQFHPLRADKTNGQGGTNGAKTGRLSSSDPNLQNIPSRTKEGKKIRRAFINSKGTRRLRKYDYSQIEYRMLAHFAVDDGDGTADKLRYSYVNDPDVDYHDVVYYAACPYMGWNPADEDLKKEKRKPIKNTNFGLLYGQGQGKLSRTMGLSPEQSRQFFTAYHSAAPYVKPTMKMCSDEVNKYGYVRTILGRRTRFDLWAPFSWGDEDALPLPYEQALRRYGSNIERAYSYRAVNYKFQGSAADMMKSAIDQCETSGVFAYTGVPLLTVHDELVFDEYDDSAAVNDAFRYMQHVMENAIPLRVPVKADPEFGPNWADVRA